MLQLELHLAKVNIVCLQKRSSSLSSKGRRVRSTTPSTLVRDSPATIFVVNCRAAIAKLREDNAKLKEELLLENKFSVTPTSSNLSANIANLQDQSDVYTRKVSA